MGTELDRYRIYRFRLDRILGKGGTGVVYRGIDTNSGDVVAVKIFHQNYFRNRMHVRELAKTVPRFAEFKHPNVVQLREFIDGEEGTCLVEEYVDGPDLKWYIANRPYNLQERIVVITQICSGLQYIHDQGFTHHDLKPANILFTRRGQVKLTDYSLSPTRWFGLLDAGLSEQVTPMYVAPEIIKREKATPQTDMYSLGVTLYLMFTGETPFKSDNLQVLYQAHLQAKPQHPSELNRRCPRNIGDIIMRLMAKDPKKRYENCDQLRVVFSDAGRSRI